MQRLISSVLTILALTMTSAETASAQRAPVGSFGDWSAHVDGSGPKRSCYVASRPKKSEGKYSARGGVFLLVTHRPAEKTFGEISVEAGYTYKTESRVEVIVDGDRRFTLFTQGGNAWAADAAGDQALVDAFRRGTQAVIKGTSSRGTQTTDTFSLSGFTAAMTAIDKACGVK